MSQQGDNSSVAPRWVWPVPVLANITSMFKAATSQTAEERARRFQFVLREFGPPSDMLLIGGISAMFALHELRMTYVDGHYLSTVLTAQVFLEQSLGHQLILAGEDVAAEGGLGAILRRLSELTILEPNIAERLSEVHRMRIAYGHPHVGLKPRSLMKRIIDRGAIPEEMVESDARFAIQAVVDYLRRSQPDWNPDNPDFAELVKSEYGQEIE